MGRATSKKYQADGDEYTKFQASEILPPESAEPKPTPLASAMALLSSGHSDISAVNHLRNGHGLSLERAQAVIEAAYEKITVSQKRAPEQKMAIAIEQRMKVVAAAMDREDYRTALAAMEQREKLLGLTGPEALSGNEFASTLLNLMELAARTGNLTEQAVGNSRPDKNNTDREKTDGDKDAQ